ncbi:MAG: HAD family hydrolase [Microcoleaceae cyanobacterium]
MVNIQVREMTFTDIEAIIFDKDGTLQDSRDFLRSLALRRSRFIDSKIPGVGEPLSMAFGVEAHDLNPTGLMAVGSRRENEIAAAAYIAETGVGWLESNTIARQAFDEADEWLKKDTVPPALFPGSLEVLKSLHQAGVKLGILSADSPEAVNQFVQYYQLSPYLQLQMGVEGDLTKPDPALFLQGCDRLGVTPSVTLMVGDSPGDMQMAATAGAAGCIGICDRAIADAFKKADVVITKLDDIQIRSL